MLGLMLFFIGISDVSAKQGINQRVCCSDFKFYPSLAECAARRLIQLIDSFCNEHVENAGALQPSSAPSDRVAANGYTGALGQVAQGVFQRQCICTDVVNIVCGSDGVVYASACRAECGGATPLFFGTCDAPVDQGTPSGSLRCVAARAPICVGEIKYENQCLATTLGAMGQPGASNCARPCNCELSFRPVCGRNGQSFMNACHASCGKTSILFEGLCEQKKFDKCLKCARQGGSKVCGTNNQTYNNKCFLECDGAQLKDYGACGAGSGNSCVCPKLYLPVCAKGGKTYENACELDCAGAKLDYNGVCGQGTQSECMYSCWTRPTEPICADDVSYSNDCFWQCSERSSGKKSRRVSRGSCGVKADEGRCGCSEDRPVCGENFVSYASACASMCANVPIYSSGACGYNAIYSPSAPRFDFGCDSSCKSKFFGSRSGLKVPYVLVPNLTGWSVNDDLDTYRRKNNCSNGGSCCVSNCGGAIYQLPGLGFTPTNPFMSSGFNPNVFAQVPSVNALSGLLFPGMSPSVATNPLAFVQQSQPTPPISVYATTQQTQLTQIIQTIQQNPQLTSLLQANPTVWQALQQNMALLIQLTQNQAVFIQLLQNQQMLSQVMQNPALLQTLIQQYASTQYVQTGQQQFPQPPQQQQQFTQTQTQTQSSSGASVSQVNFGTSMSQISIDFSTATSTANIPQTLKVQFQKAPYLYYMYFYSLIYYKYATPETTVQGVMVKDLLLYIAQTLLNIVPELGNSAGATIQAAPGSPSTATFAVSGQVQGSATTATSTSSSSQSFVQQMTPGFNVGSGF